MTGSLKPVIACLCILCAVLLYPLAGTADASNGLAELGERLFHDKRLSADGSISCASCHQPEKAFTDGLRVAQGIGGQSGTRNTPSLLNLHHATSFFWDGRRTTLEAQAGDPFVNPQEHGFAHHDHLLAIIRADKHYRQRFTQQFGAVQNPITLDNVTRAIAAFERTLVSQDSPFDRYLYGQDQTALSEAARRGYQLFIGRAQCVTCHHIGKQEASFTDNAFHSLGVGYRKIESRLAEITTRLARSGGKSLDQQIISDAELSELGRFAVTLDPRDIGKFRTPSLRNVALTAPYMHDGSIATLEDAVELELYIRRPEAGRTIVLTAVEKTDLLAFLNSLNTSLPGMFRK